MEQAQDANLEQPITVERRKGLFSTLGTPESLEYLPGFVDEPQLVDLDGNKFFTEFLVEPQGGLGNDGRKLAKALKEFFERYDRQPVPGSEERRNIRIAVNELHCPRIAGAKGKLTVEQTREEKSACMVTIFGAGGGDEFVVTLTTSETMETENNCIAMTHLIPAVFQKYRMNTPDGGQIEFVQLKEVERRSLITKAEVLSPDACQTAIEQYSNLESPTIDLRNVTRSQLTKRLRIDTGYTWSSEANVSLEKLALDLGVKYEATKKYSTELEYSLVEGYAYKAIMSPDSASWLWSWEPRQP